MKNLFYISSSGSMATAWISKLLSSSPRIKCFHGSVGLTPTYDSSLALEPALELMAEYAKRERIDYAGCVHLSAQHGISGLDACRKKDATFCAFVRNPVLAVDSQFQERSRSFQLTSTREQVYSSMLTSVPDLDKIVDPADKSSLIFLWCAGSAIGHYLQIEATRYKYFKFEDYTADYQEVSRILQFITKGELSDDHNINAAYYSHSKTNTHRKSNIGVEETWEKQWSQTQKAIFREVWRHVLGSFDRPQKIYPELDSLLAS